MSIFSNIIGIISNTFSLNKGAKEIIELTVDPTAGGGVVAPIGSVGLRDNSGAGEHWIKIGAANTAWTLAGSGGVFGTEVANASSIGESTTTLVTFQNKVTVTLTSIPAGDYLITWDAQFGGEDTGTEFQIELFQTTQIDLSQIVPPKKSSAGHYPKVAGHSVVTLTAATHTFEIRFRTLVVGKEARIKNAHLIAYRIS